MLILVTQETRESVLLSRKANYLNKQSVGARYIVRLNEQRASLATIMKISLTRPFFLFFTEPTLQAFTAIISFAWADLYLLLVSVPMVFKEVYGFSVGQTGLAFSIFIISTCVAGAVARYTNRLYLANVESKGPEARMYTGVLGGLLLPLGCWIWAWTTFPSIHWILPTIGLGISYTGIFFLYLTVFSECQSPEEARDCIHVLTDSLEQITCRIATHSMHLAPSLR